MIIEFLLSLLTLCVTSTLCSLTSGGIIWEIIEFPLLPGIPVILAIMIYLSGNGKLLLNIFKSKKKLAAIELPELKRIESAVSFSLKALIYICLFFTLISGIYFYLNIDEMQTLGPNLATIICSVYYLCFFGMILLTLKGKLKKQIINFMAEEKIESPAGKMTSSQIAFRILKIVICLSAIIAMFWITFAADTINHSNQEPLSFGYMRDLPGLIYIFVPTLLLLAISGNFKNFFRAIKFCFRGEKLSVTQKSISVNAIETIRLIFFFEGIMAALGGCMGMLCNLEDRSMLGINFVIACIPFIYGLLLNLILLPVESKVSKLAD